MSLATTFPTPPSNPASCSIYGLPGSDLGELRRLEPINIGTLSEQCMGDLSFGLAMLEKLANTFPERLATLEAAANRGDSATIAMIAPFLKGVAGMFAVNVLIDVCADLESAANSGHVSHTRELIHDLRRECRHMIEFLPVIRAIAQRIPESLSA